MTASYIAAELGLPMRCVPGLAECAAAVHQQRIANFNPMRPGGPRFLTEAEARPHCAPGTRFTDASVHYEPFFDAVERVAREGAGSRVLLVTHREGIRDLSEVAGEPCRRTPYCCIARFAFAPSHEGKGKAVSPWQLLSPPSIQLD
jgi:broad specificity phosphatase PhoE